MKGTIMSVSLSIFMIITDARYEGQWLFFAHATAIDPHNRLPAFACTHAHAHGHADAHAFVCTQILGLEGEGVQMVRHAHKHGFVRWGLNEEG